MDASRVEGKPKKWPFWTIFCYYFTQQDYISTTCDIWWHEIKGGVSTTTKIEIEKADPCSRQGQTTSHTIDAGKLKRTGLGDFASTTFLPEPIAHPLHCETCMREMLQKPRRC